MNLNKDNMTLDDNSERLLPLDGTFNFRDLGGYTTQDGSLVSSGKIFRADDLDDLSDQDLKQLSELPLKTIVDFRTKDEVEKAPDLVASSVNQEVWLPITPGNINLIEQIQRGQGVEAMEEVNRIFVRDYQDVYAKFLNLLVEEENVPLVFHCSAGKDRTGYAAALFLGALGVDKQYILQDYMISARLMQVKYADIINKKPELEPAYTVRPSYIKAALEVIDNEYGGMDNYLTHYLKADTDRLKELYTE